MLQNFLSYRVFLKPGKGEAREIIRRQYLQRVTSPTAAINQYICRYMAP